MILHGWQSLDMADFLKNLKQQTKIYLERIGQVKKNQFNCV